MTPRIRRFIGLAAVALLPAALALLPPAPARAVDQVPAPGSQVVRRAKLDIDVWVNKDEGGVYRPGESMRIYFRTNADAYVLLYNIDTDGYIHLIYPYGPADRPFSEGGRTIAIPSRSDPYELAADGPPGVEYVVALASPVPFRDLPWYLDEGTGARAPEDQPGDPGDDADAGYIVGDPYVGMQHLNERIVPPGRENEVASSDTYFYIDRRVDYPRYVCADCHYHQAYFDPYGPACPVVDIHVDAAWIHYAPLRYDMVRPRYYYLVRPGAPARYRMGKDQWSSRDGMTTLRQRFVVGNDAKARYQNYIPNRPQPRQYFDIRRYRPGRIWQGRDEVLRLRERRDEMQRQRQDAARQRQEYQRPREDQRGRGGPPPGDQGRPTVRDRGQSRERAEPPPQRGRPEVRQRDERGQGGQGNQGGGRKQGGGQDGGRGRGRDNNRGQGRDR